MAWSEILGGSEEDSPRISHDSASKNQHLRQRIDVMRNSCETFSPFTNILISRDFQKGPVSFVVVFRMLKVSKLNWSNIFTFFVKHKHFYCARKILWSTLLIMKESCSCVVYRPHATVMTSVGVEKPVLKVRLTFLCSRYMKLWTPMLDTSRLKNLKVLDIYKLKSIWSKGRRYLLGLLDGSLGL
jgi:hypothetical protein